MQRESWLLSFIEAKALAPAWRTTGEREGGRAGRRRGTITILVIGTMFLCGRRSDWCMSRGGEEEGGEDGLEGGEGRERYGYTHINIDRDQERERVIARSQGKKRKYQINFEEVESRGDR